MATVFLCRRSGEAGFQRLFAVKVLHPHLANEEAFVRMLIDEARIAAHLHHPHAVGILDIGYAEGARYLVMDYVEGCSLADLLRRPAVPGRHRMAVRVLVDTLNGLHAAHTAKDDDDQPLGLVHRDVSPHNMLVGTDGNARITDFGIAKARARITLTEPSVVKGKFNYLAPEQLLLPDKIDHRIDIFAAGVVLWTSLTGVQLFEGESEQETVRNVVRGEIPRPSTVGLQPPACFDEICLKALARDRAARYQTAAEMASALRQAAIVADCLASPLEVGDWVRACFEPEIQARRQAVRELGLGSMGDRTSNPPSAERASYAAITPTPSGAASPLPPVREAGRGRWVPLALAAGVGLVSAFPIVWVSRCSPSEGAAAAASSSVQGPAPTTAPSPSPSVTPVVPARPAPSTDEQPRAPVASARSAPPPENTPIPSRRNEKRNEKPSKPQVDAPAPAPTPAPTPTPTSAQPVQVETNPYLR